MTSSLKTPRTNPYDAWIGQMIPGYDVMHRLAEVCLGAELRTKARVLMVGAGTGAEVLASGKRHPGWTITAAEPDARMSERARKKIAAAGLTRQVRWHEGSLATLKPSPPFDAATLIIVLQFLADAQKLALLREIGRRLKPGAPLILATFVGDRAAAQTKNAYDLCRAWAIGNGLDPDDAARRITHQREDVHLVTEAKMSALARKAGYVDMQRIYQALPVTAWLARTTR
jgi:tRNA (cmo5U34)-methyltransferase